MRFILVDEAVRSRAVTAVADAPDGFVVRIEEPRRSLESNAKLHAELAEIAESVEWAGKKRDIEVWKRLITAAWLRARGESIEILPALDGHGIDVVWRKTSTLTKAEMSELLEFLMAWKAEHMEEQTP